MSGCNEHAGAMGIRTGAVMADRNVHYEAAFEAFLRHRGIPYVAVDEAKKALFANSKLKSFDFVVYSRNGPNLLIDVKGRQRRDGTGSRRSYESWATQRDVEDLLQWEQVFGEGFRAILAFVYWIQPPLTPEPGMFEHRDRWYLLMGIELSEYRNHMRRRSPKWETVSLSAEDFRQLARPIECWL
ncbi:HYExAFE family protein [Fontivita pretiosa]|uniref:HYExAFE family protein n=1 Tax=Fontivita pretiosa TaxID=2989684 RepID=UPI003D166B9E